MSKGNRLDKVLRDIRMVNLRVDWLINEINYNIEKTNREISERRKK